MWRKFISNAILPILFVSVGAFSALVVADISKQHQNATKPLETEEVASSYAISPYDHIFQAVGEKYGIDWLLLAAIARTESQFRFDAVSKVGAVGLMQVTPIVGRQFNVDKEHLSDPETNIRLATKLLRKIDATLKMSSSTPENDRMSIILACYNGGIGHVSDARRLAKSNGENPNSWEVVARYLQQKADPAVYESELVKYGKFTGSRQTEAYVREVMKRYDVYCKMTSQQ